MPRTNRPPALTIEIRGPWRGGKSTVAHLIRAALKEAAIDHAGPADLPPIDVSPAVANLRLRGLRITLSEIETGERTQIDARRNREAKNAAD